MAICQSVSEAQKHFVELSTKEHELNLFRVY